MPWKLRSLAPSPRLSMSPLLLIFRFSRKGRNVSLSSPLWSLGPSCQASIFVGLVENPAPSQSKGGDRGVTISTRFMRPCLQTGQRSEDSGLGRAGVRSLCEQVPEDSLDSRSEEH